MASPTGEKNLSCGGPETTIYEWDDLDPEQPVEAPPIRSITGHAKNSDGKSKCPVTFTYYRLKKIVGPIDKVESGESTSTHTGRWAKVTAKCEGEKPEKSHECHISWTESA